MILSGKFLAALMGAAVCLVSSVWAKVPHAALQSQEAFQAEITGKTWETSFTTYPRVRFESSKIEILNERGNVTSTLTNISHPEPGIVRVDFRTPGAFVLFVFGDDLETFVIANMQEMSTLVVEGGKAETKLPLSANESPLTVTFTDNPFWKAAHLHSNKMEILDSSGAVFATNESYSYSPRVQGVVLPERRAGALILSRHKPGTGWYVSGLHLGTGVRTEKSGVFRTFVRSALRDFPLRSAHFSYALLRAGQEQMAHGQEQFSLSLVRKTHGENSDKVAYCLNEMGTLRRNTRSYQAAVALKTQALEHAQQSLSDNKVVRLDFANDLARSQNEAGDFALAKKTLAGAFTLLPAPGGQAVPTYLFYEALGTAEFGLRNYAVAAQHFIDNGKRAREGRMLGSVVESALQLIPCQLAQNQPDLALASLKQALTVQDEREKANPGRNFDTWKLAFACVALGKNTEAVKYSPVVQQRANWIAYEEYGRLLSLFHADQKAEAQALAKSFVGRFRDIQEINVRDDIDPITVQLTQTIAEPTPANVSALEQLWGTQVESLKNRPLKNYLFARVMVLTLAKLKTGK